MNRPADTANLNDSVKRLIKTPLAKCLLSLMSEQSNIPHTYRSRQEGFRDCVMKLYGKHIIRVISYGGISPEFHFRGQLEPDYQEEGKYYPELTELCANVDRAQYKIECIFF